MMGIMNYHPLQIWRLPLSSRLQYQSSIRIVLRPLQRRNFPASHRYIIALIKASVLFLRKLLFSVYGSLNEVRTRVLALRGLRPRPLVDEATYSFTTREIYHEKIFSATFTVFEGTSKIRLKHHCELLLLPA